MSNFVTSSSSSSVFDDFDVVEHTLVQIRNVHVFQVPRIVNSGGHRATDFQQEVWQGNLKIVEKKMEAAIFLLDAKDSSKIFAVCPIIDGGSVERCIDSSRYYVLKIKNQQGKHAFIGLAFDTRDQAFDFNVALQEYEKDKQRAKDEKEGKFIANDVTSSQPSRDLSLKEGQKLSISLPGGSKKKRSPNTNSQSNTGGGGLITLAPPPSGGSTTDNKFGLLAPPSGSSGSQVGSGDTRRRGVKGTQQNAPSIITSQNTTNTNTTITSPTGFSPGAWENMNTALPNTNSSTSGTSNGFDSFPSDDPFGSPFGTFSPTGGTQNKNNTSTTQSSSGSGNTEDDILDFLGT